MENKFVNFGTTFWEKYCTAGDILLFELCSRTEFTLAVFCQRRVEKNFSLSSFIPGTYVSSLSSILFYESDMFKLSSNWLLLCSANDISTLESAVSLPNFDVILIRSNLDMNAHGVVIIFSQIFYRTN